MPLLARVAARSVERLSRSYVRVELAGADLVDFGVDGPTHDQRIKLLFPGPAGLPALGAQTWWQDFCALPEAERGSMRTYTIREVRGEGADVGIVVDFVLHLGAHGPGSDWAGGAQVGDELLIVVPRRGEPFGGIEWAPGDAERLLLVGDETAVPAICSILGSLPEDAVGEAFLEVPTDGDVQKVDAPAGLRLTWLPRNGAPVGSVCPGPVGRLLGFSVALADARPAELDLWETPTYSSSGEALGEAPAPADGWYAWIAGESRMVTALRRHLVGDLGLSRSRVAFMGYWRAGVAMRG